MTDTDTLTRPYQLGDRVTYNHGGRNYAGTVRGLFHVDGTGVDGSSNSHAPSSVFVTNANPDNRPHVAYLPVVGDYTGEQYRWATIPEGEQGLWASLAYDGVALDPTAETATVSDTDAAQLVETITRLRAELSEQQALVTTAHDVVRQIGEALADTADRSEWCDEYESKVERLVGNLPSRGGFDSTFSDSANRAHDYTVSFTGSVSVTARNAEAAQEAFGNLYVGDLDSYSLEISDVERDD